MLRQQLKLLKLKSTIPKLVFWLTIWLGLQLGYSAFAQEEDSTFYQKLKYKPNFQLNNRRSLLNDELVQFWGFKLGLKLNKHHEIGVCYTFMPYNLSFNDQVADSNFNATALLNFTSFYYEPTILFRRKWEIDLPFTFGTGMAKINYNSTHLDDDDYSRKTRVYVFEPSILAYYKIYKYASIGVGGGYRKTLGADKEVNQSFTAPFIQAKIRLEFEAIGKDVRKYLRKRKAKKTFS